MKRLLVLLISLFTLAAGVFAFPLYLPPNVVKLPLSNGRSLQLNFAAPKDALPYFDNSILQDGFSKLSGTYKLSNDFTVTFAPQDTRELQFGLSFDSMPQDHIAALRPVANAQGLRGLPLLAPRDALAVVQAWYKSFLANTSPDKPTAFLATTQKTIFTVIYDTKAPLSGKPVGLTMSGTIQNDTPVFKPHLDVEEYSTLTNHGIDLSDQAYLQALQSDSFFILEPISDPDNPGLKRKSVFVYMLFDKTAPK